MPHTTLTLFICFASLSFTLSANAIPATKPSLRIVESLDISPVWPDEPVGFQLLTHQGKQYVAFYDANRRMVVGSGEKNRDNPES